ncbi:Lysozyme [uncultured Alphaproteobacteria bacterium]|uniref:Lysozyme n=1 Tax=uncultured Alphaproteobacteria bacterium TaxID=91750 RepID=A0A212J450_9PROT|nr:Lysozyme [uncultured Alphaproteobacteria bacterium]
MTPLRSHLSKAVLALVLAGAPATVIAQQFIAEHEGITLKAFRDGAAKWTICRGHTAGVQPGDTATPEQCAAFFATDIGIAFADLDRAVKVDMPETMRAALASWFFHVGGGKKARESTLIRKANAGDRQGACDELPRWVFSGGKDCRIAASNCGGIVERRAAERELCLL